MTFFSLTFLTAEKLGVMEYDRAVSCMTAADASIGMSTQRGV